jgi:hypothetical protein
MKDSFGEIRATGNEHFGVVFSFAGKLCERSEISL